MKRGFTLIELLVVIAIIGLLAAIVFTSLSSARTKAKDSKRLSDLRNLSTALELYANDHNGSYPSTGGVDFSQCPAWGGYAANNVISGLVPTYMPSMPADPDMSLAASTYCYTYDSNGTDYKIRDYNLVNSDLTPYPVFVDRNYNVGRAWVNNTGCPGAVASTISLAVWSSATSMCW